LDEATPDDPDDMGRLVGVLLPSHAPKCFNWLVSCTRNRSCSLKIAALSTCGVGLRFRNRQWAWNMISSSIPLSMFDMLLLWRGLLLLAVVAVVVVALTNRFVVGYRRMDWRAVHGAAVAGESAVSWRGFDRRNDRGPCALFHFQKWSCRRCRQRLPR
jgi:hypothetical protein